ncbi:helix-turn-helix domain-containing protein [Rhizobium sp. P28RR-XV]|uniref:helix-turn-helix domain-containing protein n=1 Tax=Rhizobium sp. P28RR-XV TaxID=2726737 RepID=UPI001456E2D9|nr:helix-turn-helix domain-containing protein [Rhizobium sp. P28RR-XV]
MADSKFLTPDEVAERYRDGISLRTLRNWRATRLGLSFVKIGKVVLYPLDELGVRDELRR